MKKVTTIQSGNQSMNSTFFESSCMCKEEAAYAPSTMHAHIDTETQLQNRLQC